MSVRSFYRLFFSLLLSSSLLGGGVVSCTTGGDEGGSEIEGELDSELDELSGDGISDLEGDDSSSGDADLDAALAEVSDGDMKDVALEDASLDDDSFLNDDSDTPGGSSDALAEQDLEKELEAGDMAGDASAMDDMTVTSVPNSAEPPPMEPVMDPMNPGAQGNPAAATGMITSREVPPSDDAFEYINPAPGLPQEDLGISDPLMPEVDAPLPSEKAAQELVPLRKLRREPFMSGDRLMNAAYITRPGDDLGTISEKIFKGDRSADLQADNPDITKGIEPGMVIYYNSPNRPEDRTSVLTFYEDNKIKPSYYTTKRGDDILQIGRRILGYEDAWKEIWVLNDSLQAQAQLPSGIKVRYWSGNETAREEEPATSPADAMASASVPATSPMASSSLEPEVETPVDIPPPSETAMANDINMEDPSMSGSPLLNDPPPILPDNIAASVPSPQQSMNQGGSLGTVAGIALVALAVLALIAIQIKNRKKSEQGLPPSLEFTKV